MSFAHGLRPEFRFPNGLLLLLLTSNAPYTSVRCKQECLSYRPIAISYFALLTASAEAVKFSYLLVLRDSFEYIGAI